MGNLAAVMSQGRGTLPLSSQLLIAPSPRGRGRSGGRLRDPSKAIFRIYRHIWELFYGNFKKTFQVPLWIIEGGNLWESPVTFIRVKRLVTGFIAIDSLHEVFHGFCRVAVFVIRAGDFNFL